MTILLVKMMAFFYKKCNIAVERYMWFSYSHQMKFIADHWIDYTTKEVILQPCISVFTID